MQVNTLRKGSLPLKGWLLPGQLLWAAPGQLQVRGRLWRRFPEVPGNVSQRGVRFFDSFSETRWIAQLILA